MKDEVENKIDEQEALDDVSVDIKEERLELVISSK